jgi:RecA/RadA recombinase
MSLSAILASVQPKFIKKFPKSILELKLAKDELPVTGLIVDNPALEYILDRRFIPWGRCILIYGKKGNAKTSTLFDLIKLFQNAGGFAVWVETENAADLDYAAKQGVDVSGEKLAVPHPPTLEEACTLILQLAEDYISKYPEGDGPPFLIALDSIAGCMTNWEADHEVIGETKVGDHGRTMSHFYRKLCETIATEKIVFVALNQLKDKIGGNMPGQEAAEALIGGDAQKFHSTYQWKTVRTKDLIGKDQFGAERKIGSRHVITCKRNKLGREGNSQEMEFDLYINGGADYYSPLVRTFPETYKGVVIHKDGGWYKWLVPNILYYTYEETEPGKVEKVEKMIPLETKMRDTDLGVMIASSPAAKEIFRHYFEIPALPTQEEETEIKELNKKIRKRRKKGEEDDQNPTVRAL